MLRREHPGRRHVGERLPRGAAHGDGRGVKRLAERFDDTFVVIGDALTDADVREVVAFHKERGALELAPIGHGLRLGRVSQR